MGVRSWFSFNDKAEIDEIRVLMRDMQTSKTIKKVRYKTTAKWTDS